MAKEGTEKILFDKGNYFPNRAIAFEILKTFKNINFCELFQADFMEISNAVALLSESDSTILQVAESSMIHRGQFSPFRIRSQLW